MIRLIICCLIFNLFMVRQGNCCGKDQGKWQSREWIVQDYVFFYCSDTLDKEIEIAKKRYGDTVNLDFMKVDEPVKWQEILRRYKIKGEATKAILVSPMNELLWESDKQMITAQMLEEIADSPMREKIARALKNHKAVILAILDQSSKQYKEREYQICRAVKIAEEFYNMELPVRVLDISDPREKVLLKNIGIKKDTQEAVAFILGNGKVVAVMEKNITQDTILNTLDLFNPGCVCELQPFLGYRKDLLLKREK